MKALIGKLVFPLYLIAMAFFTWAALQSHLDARQIMRDHTVTEAQMELTEVVEKRRKRRTSYTYKFNYFYTVDGTEYAGHYAASNEKGERYIDNPMLTIAYANSDPARADSLSVLERQSSLKSVLFRLLIAAAILGFVALVIKGWTMPDEEDDTEPANEPAK